VVDEENGIFAALYLDCLFEEGDPGQERSPPWCRPICRAPLGWKQAEWEATHRSTGLALPGLTLEFLEFTLPGSNPRCHSDG